MKGTTHTGGIRKQGAEEQIWTWEGESGRVEETA
jgi:hypothetical protein